MSKNIKNYNSEIEESELVYEALKNSALHCEDGIRTARIYMYAVYFALIAFGFNYRWMFLVSFFVLIAFQSMMNNDRIAVERISSYIRIFFESKRDDMHWSLLNKDEAHEAIYHAQYKNIGWYINHAGASILSMVSLLAMLTNTIYEYKSIDMIPSLTWVELMLGLLLCGLTVYINGKMYTSAIRGKNIISAIDDSIGSFYNRERQKLMNSMKLDESPEQE